MRTIESYPFRKANSIKKPDNSSRLLALHIYTFKNRKGTLYIVNVEEYQHDVFILKFFTKKHRESKKKYNILTKERDARRIIFTCITIAMRIHETNSLSSFGFIGSPTINELKRENRLEKTKRYKVYRNFAKFFFSPDNYLHSVNEDFSMYLLYNREHIKKDPDLQQKVECMFLEHYDVNQLLEIAPDIES